MTSVCRIQGVKCVKCNGPHKSEHHCQFAWCCKANEKTNPSRLETKKKNCALTPSSVWITKGTISQIWTYALSGSINLIENGIQKNIKSFVKVDDN